MTVKRSIKYIGVIQSLPIKDAQTGSELYNDVIRRRIDGLQDQSIKMMHSFFNSKSKQEFIDALRYFDANATTIPGGLLIHLETHGSADLDGLVLADNSLITWKELIDIFREINIKTCNKLFITMANCNGRFLLNGADPYKKSPYQAYISASTEVSSSEILEKFSILFEHLIGSGDLISAYRALEADKTNFFYKDSEKTFEESIKMYVNDPSKMTNLNDWMETYPELKELFPNGELKQESIDKIRELVFNDIYNAQREAFNFDNC
jgi:hypothetical protein